MVTGVAGHVLDSAYMIGTLRQRTQTLTFKANPRRVSSDSIPVAVRPYAGPVAILMDPLSGSTSEFFAAGLQGLGRARIIGEVSAGRALPALMVRLPNDDVLMHVIADLTDSRGRRVEGVGVIPDHVVPLNAKSLEAGRDDALEAALRWAASQPRPTKQD
jgi:carboxyl-terminal processing protease